jgi:hypothetical protein
MINLSDIFSFLKFIKPEKTNIICRIDKTHKIGEYEFIIKNLSNKSVEVLKLIVDDIEFPKNFNVFENHRRFPIKFIPYQEIKYRLFLTKESHFPKKTEIVFKTFLNKKSIKQVL